MSWSSTMLFHYRHAEVRGGVHALSPASGHGLDAGVEAHALGAVLVHVAEDRALPAAESVERERHRDRHVDADHAAVDLVGEVARDVAVAGEDRAAVAVLVVRGKRERLLEGLRAHHRQHRPEDLLLIDAHVLADIVEEAAAEEEAVRL